MGYLRNSYGMTAFLDEVGVRWTVEGKGPHAGEIKVPEPVAGKRSDNAWHVFFSYASGIERIKHHQAREGKRNGYEFPIYDHPSVLQAGNGELIFLFTPYHSTRIIGFMPAWMHLSDNPWYMGERAIWSRASEIPPSVDEDEIGRIASLPPLDEARGLPLENINAVRNANLANLEHGGPYMTEVME